MSNMVAEPTAAPAVAHTRNTARSSRAESQKGPNPCGRTASVVVLTALSIALLFADVIAFGRDGGGIAAEFVRKTSSGGYVAEVTLFASVAILILTKSATVNSWIGRPERSPSLGRGTRKLVDSTASCSNSSPKGGAPGGCLQAAARKAANAAVSKWNKAIDVAARQGDVAKAGQLLLEFESSGAQPESVSYNLVIRACAKQGDAVTAEKWLRRMESKGVPATVCSYNTLLDACAKADNADACELWFKRMESKGIQPNVISYATAIYARARRGHVDLSEKWLRKMIEAGVEPDAVSYNSLIHACGVKGDAAGAERWLEEMSARGLETSVATYTAVIDACAKQGDVARAERWFDRIVDRGVEPNVVTFSAMIDTCAKAGNLTRAEYWHDRMLQQGISPNAHSYSAVINACAKSGDANGPQAAERWLDRSEEAGVTNDVVVYSSVIDACGKAGDAERAMRVFRRMRSNGIKPHIIAYAALARPFAYRGDWIKVESIAQNMKVDGVRQNEYFVYAQILSYAVARPRQAHRAELCFRAALDQGVQVNDHVIGVLARAVTRTRCAELMNELCGGRDVPLPPARRNTERNWGNRGDAGGSDQSGRRSAGNRPREQ